MVCAGLETLVDQSITGILAFPTSCDYYFYLKMMAAFFIVGASSLFFAEKLRYQKGDMLSCMGISAIATIFMSILGTFLKIIQPDIFIEILVACMIIIAIWIIKK